MSPLSKSLPPLFFLPIASFITSCLAQSPLLPPQGPFIPSPSFGLAAGEKDGAAQASLSASPVPLSLPTHQGPASPLFLALPAAGEQDGAAQDLYQFHLAAVDHRGCRCGGSGSFPRPYRLFGGRLIVCWSRRRTPPPPPQQQPPFPATACSGTSDGESGARPNHSSSPAAGEMGPEHVCGTATAPIPGTVSASTGLPAQAAPAPLPATDLSGSPAQALLPHDARHG